MPMLIREFEGTLPKINPAIYIVFALAIFLSSCASSRDSAVNYIYEISKGDKFVLKKDIPIITRNRHVYLQDGELKHYANVNKYSPYCRFEVSQEGAHTVKPTSITITRVTQHQLLEPSFVFNNYVRFDLRAAQNPNIRGMTCGAWGSATDNYPMTYLQMQQALGNYFEIPEPK